MTLVWTARAARHLEAAYRYWSAEKSDAAADAMLERIFSVVELLENHAEMGREGRIAEIREFIVTPLPFLIAYRLGRRRTEIVALLHGARKWPPHF